MRRLLYSTFVQRKPHEVGKPNPLVPLHCGLDPDAAHHPQPQKKFALADFTHSIYTDESGVQFRIRKSDQTVYTYRPSTKELVALCSVADWPKMIVRLGLKVRPEAIVKRTGVG